MRINIAEVAKKAKVSPATVSRVLNGVVPVKEETKARVLAVIAENRYVPNAAAQNLGGRKLSNNIGLFVPDMDNPFFGEITKCITRIADQFEYNVFLFNTDETQEREHRFLQSVKGQNLRGLIMIPLSSRDSESEAYLRELEENGTPVVLLDRRFDNANFDGVYTDDSTDARRAVETLIRSGHRKIATITGAQRSTSGYARLQGYREAMTLAGLPVRDEYIREGDFKMDRAYEEMNALLALPEPPSAVFTANNFSTLGALQSIFEHGLKVGTDISLLGFDEIAQWQWYPWLANTGVGLSLVERPVEQVAREAMYLLQNRISKNSREDACRTMSLSNEIVLRGSEKLKQLNL